jgi:hypothetical protein
MAAVEKDNDIGVNIEHVIEDIAREDRAFQVDAEHEDVPVTMPTEHPCSTCPWRLKWRDRPSRCFARPGREVLERAWVGYHGNPGARDGAVVLCHVGVDERTPDPDQRPPEHRACSAALGVQARALIRWNQGEEDIITATAAARIAARMGLDVDDLLAGNISRQQIMGAAHPATADPRIGAPVLAAPLTGEFEAASGPGLASWPPPALPPLTATPSTDQGLSAVSVTRWPSRWSSTIRRSACWPSSVPMPACPSAWSPSTRASTSSTTAP